MRTFVLGLLGALLLAAPAWGKPKDRPDLKLMASIENSNPDEQTTLVVSIQNMSGHTLKIPDPPLLCSPAPGALSLNFKFSPLDSHAQIHPNECDSQVDGGGLPDIRERAKDWLTLKSGQSYQARRPLSMGLDAGAPGTYEIWITYNSPCANATELQELQDSGIATAEGSFKSEKITYKVGTPK